MSDPDRMRRNAWSRRELLRAAAALPLAGACGSQRRTPDAARSGSRATARGNVPRNVLVVLADDLGGRDLGCYGNGDARTPAIDRLASEGMRFERAYTAVGMCQPSRSSLYTGLYPVRHGAMGFGPIRDGVATWPELLNERGFATALIGKLDVEPLAKFPFGFQVLAKDMASRRDPDEFASRFREFLAGRGGRPFAAVIAFSDPHRPFEEGATKEPVTDRGALRVPPSLWDAPGTRLDLARYYDCIARLDRSVERVLAVLDESGAAGETLVVFTSDNGASFPFAKATLYEAGVRMPLIARGPGVVGGETDELVSLVDVLPTVLELFGAPPRDLDGLSLAPVLRGEGGLGREALVTMQTETNREQGTPARALHQRRFKLIRNFGEGASVSNVVGHTATWDAGKELALADPEVARRMREALYRPKEELYDLQRDPHELANLIEAPEHRQRVESMRAELRSWMERHGDPASEEWDG